MVSYYTIYIFKNYFIIVFSVFNNKHYLNSKKKKKSKIQDTFIVKNV